MPPNAVGSKMDDPSNFSLVQFDYPISEKGSKFKSTKQLTWLLVLRVQRVTSTVSNSIKILTKRGAFFKKQDRTTRIRTRTSTKILTFLKIIFTLSFLTLLFELYAHWNQWNLGHMIITIRPHEVTSITHGVYLKWLTIRADYIAPLVVCLSRFCIVLFLVQSADRFVQCVGCFWIKCRRLKPVLPKNAGSYYPMVLVQIPMCNEKEVYEQSISAACNLDWPRDRLLIQILDDSDNKLVQILIKSEVSRWKQKGANIIYRHRYYRTGYKAGNLSSAMACDYVRDYQFVALFDADFKPDPDFLKKTIPHFKDNPQLALVQARWSFINKEENLLTRLQHINLAFHFEVEQQVNGVFLNFFGFNGTAGVWRIKALEDSGGWLERTTVEDMDIAVRAHLKGWKFIFLNDVKVLCEVPESYKAYKKQQHRWHSGPMQLFRLCLPSIISSKISVWKKMNLIFLFFLLRKLILPFYSFTLFCIILPLTMFIPEAELPVWVICYVPVIISFLNILPSPKSFPFIIPYLMFENTMSVTKFAAMISGLFRLGSSYEWEVTKKTGRYSDTDLIQIQTRENTIEKSVSESDIELGHRVEDEKEQKINNKKGNYRVFKNELFLAFLLLTAAARSLLSAQGVHFYFLLFQGISFLVVGLDLIGEQV